MKRRTATTSAKKPRNAQVAQSGFHDHVVHDLLGHIPEVTSRAMFGGWALYRKGLIFAIIADGELFFKVDDTNRGDYECHGSRPFVYAQGDHKPTTMSYWAVPGAVLEDKEMLRKWVERSVQVSRRSKK